MSDVACPIPGCSGRVFVRHLKDFSCFSCDGDPGHGDGEIRGLFLMDDKLDEAEGRREMREMLRRADEVAWLKDCLIEARNPSDQKFSVEPLGQVQKLPTYATGFTRVERGVLLELRGMTTLSGIASSGKSWFALGAAVNSAADGWDVHYLAAEGEDVINRRVSSAGRVPDGFTLHSIEPGLTVHGMLDEIESWICRPKTLIVVDSISTLLGLMRSRSEDRWQAQEKIELFLMKLRSLTEGRVGILLLSEMNARGETKGRTLDHKSDISISFKSVEDSDAKEIRVVKQWEGPIGLVGRAMVDASGPGMDLLHEGPIAAPREEEW